MAANRPLRVLHMPVNIRWIMDATIQGQKELGLETRKFLISAGGIDDIAAERIDYIPVRNQGAPWKGYPSYIKAIVRYFKRYWQLLRWADVVHWQYSNRLWPKDDILRNLDFFLLKLLRKPAIVQFHGGDFRDGGQLMETNPWWHEAYDSDFMTTLTKNARKAQHDFANADFVFALGFGMMPFVKFENRARAIILERALDVAALSPTIKAPDERITIVHGPSHPTTKGTSYIKAAVEKLQATYPIDFILVENKSRDEVLDAIRKADIVIDQIISGDYGLFAVEALSLGKPVIAYLDDQAHDAYPSDIPIVGASPDTIEAALEDLIADPDRRTEIAKTGPPYAQRMHSIEGVTPEVLRAYRFAAEKKYNKQTIKLIDDALNSCQERGWKGISDE